MKVFSMISFLIFFFETRTEVAQTEIRPWWSAESKRWLYYQIFSIIIEICCTLNLKRPSSQQAKPALMLILTCRWLQQLGTASQALTGPQLPPAWHNLRKRWQTI